MRTRRLPWIVLFVCACATASVASAADTQPASKPSPLAALRTWPSLPPEKNAALAVYAVADDWIPPGLRTKAPQVDTLRLRQQTQWTAEDIEQARRWIDYWKPQIQKLEAIDSAAGFDWGDPPDSPFILQPDNERLTIAWGIIGGLLRTDGALACHEADIARAWRRAHQLRVLAEGLSHWPQEFPRSAASRIDEHHCALITEIARSTDLAQFLAVRRADVERAIRDLLEDRTLRQRYVRVLDIEEGVIQDTLACLSDGRISTANRRQVNSTCTIASRLVAAGHTSEQIAAELDVLRVYHDLVREDEPMTRSHRDSIWQARVAQPLTRDVRMAVVKQRVSPILAAQLDSVFSISAARKLAAVSLAVALYRADHEGQWPESLDQLVPRYLPAVPTDPLAREATPLRYRGGENPIIWSSGEDGSDHGGAEPREGMSYKERERTDLVVPLTPSAK